MIMFYDQTAIFSMWSTIKLTFIFWAGPGAVGATNVLNMATAVLGTSVVPPLLCHSFNYKIRFNQVAIQYKI